MGHSVDHNRTCGNTTDMRQRGRTGRSWYVPVGQNRHLLLALSTNSPLPHVASTVVVVVAEVEVVGMVVVVEVVVVGMVVVVVVAVVEVGAAVVVQFCARPNCFAVQGQSFSTWSLKAHARAGSLLALVQILFDFSESHVPAPHYRPHYRTQSRQLEQHGQ